MTNCVEGNPSKYLLEARWLNKKTKKYEAWYLDATKQPFGYGRYINRACDTYQGKLAEELQTPYHTNCRYGEEIDPKVVWYGEVGSYKVPIYAQMDIPKDVELFARYGLPYWTNFKAYVKGDDPNILIHEKYIQVTKKFV